MRGYKKLVSELMLAGFFLLFYHHVVRKAPHALHKTAKTAYHIVV